jgi:hypothetical protein
VLYTTVRTLSNFLKIVAKNKMLGNNNALTLVTYNAEASMQLMEDNLKYFIHIRRDKCLVSPSSIEGIYTQMGMYTYSMCTCQSHFSKAQQLHQQARVLLPQDLVP